MVSVHFAARSRSFSPRCWCGGIGLAFAAIGVGNRAHGEGGPTSRPTSVASENVIRKIQLDYIRFKFPVLGYKFPVPWQKFPVPLSREFCSKSAESFGE